MPSGRECLIMASKRPRKHLDQKIKYVGLPHWLLNCPAWRTLPPLAKAIYIEDLELSYNGCNNGGVKRSERQVAKPAPSAPPRRCCGSSRKTDSSDRT
jgi:hypothetical protein